MYNIIKTVTISMIQKKNTDHDVICTQQIFFVLFFLKKEMGEIMQARPHLSNS